MLNDRPLAVASLFSLVVIEIMSIPSAEEFEKLASFYLGRQFDLARGELLDSLLMYDAKDLCTHAMCVGMTGSGKTGLCLSLLEEAGIDGIPAICVDPKGDLANLLLTFPDLAPEDFLPWLEQADATRHGLSLEEYAARMANRWREGLQSWGQSADRIRRFRDSVDIAVYTPGSNIGLPMTVLKSLEAPSADSIDDLEAISDQVTGTVSALLTLLGLECDPLVSPEHILISSILIDQWRQGIHVGLGNLIRLIASPPIERVGVIDLDSFMPPNERSKLAMRLNNLLASPAFAPWLEGDALSIDRLLYRDDGRPKISILSIAHLTESERMFFVTILLHEMVAWMRRQNGTSSLRSIFYMDEVAGYFPPVANPPSKPPMLTLLKQARAYGLGVTLATQNPVDLDYKGLSNIGTWFLGRLQTERDKARVLEGLEGAAATTGHAFDRSAMEQTLAGLGNRVFLMNNVHDDGPVTFQTRWAMSYLAGPMARGQISDLMQAERDARVAAESARRDKDRQSIGETAPSQERPMVPAGIREVFLGATKRPARNTRLVYRPGLLGRASMHFIRSSADLDLWKDSVRLVSGDDQLPKDLWESSWILPNDAETSRDPDAGFGFTTLPDAMVGKGGYRSFKSKLKDYLYRHCFITLYKCPPLKGYAPGGCGERDARLHFKQLMREHRDLETERLREKFDRKIQSLEKKIRTAEDRVDREASQYETAARSTWLSAASSVIGAFMGGRRGGVTTVARGFNRASQQKDDVRRAEDALRLLKDDMRELETEFRDARDELIDALDFDQMELETVDIPPRKSDLKTDEIVIAWCPWEVDEGGDATPLFDFEHAS